MNCIFIIVGGAMTLFHFCEMLCQLVCMCVKDCVKTCASKESYGVFTLCTHTVLLTCVFSL